MKREDNVPLFTQGDWDAIGRWALGFALLLPVGLVLVGTLFVFGALLALFVVAAYALCFLAWTADVWAQRRSERRHAREGERDTRAPRSNHTGQDESAG